VAPLTDARRPVRSDVRGRHVLRTVVGTLERTEQLVSTTPASPDEPINQGPDHPDEQAELRERSDGAHAEQLAGETNFREDETPPGVDPDDPDELDEGR
jgi:hypothetical protein